MPARPLGECRPPASPRPRPPAALQALKDLDAYAKDDKGSKMKVLTTLAAYYTQKASKLGNSPEQKDLLEEATKLHNQADQVDMLDAGNLVGRGFLYIHQGEFGKADRHFEYRLTQPGGATHVPSLLPTPPRGEPPLSARCGFTRHTAST